MSVQKRPYQELQQLTFWQYLSAAEQSYLQNNLIYLTYQAGQQIISSSRQCLGVLLLLKGVLRTYLLSPNGREMTLYRTRAGETYLLTATCVLDTISFDTHVEAEEDCEVLLIPSSVYSHLIEKNIQVECSSYKLLIDGYEEAVSSIERLVFLSLEQRLASFLLDESSRLSSNIIVITHEQLATNIGSARAAVSRSLKIMEHQKLIQLLRGGIRLLNKTALYTMIS